jgi:hypothetical protein
MEFIIELTEEQLALLNMGNAYFPTGSQYGYFHLPWIKLTMGTNKAEMYVFEKDIPNELKDMIEKGGE